MKGSFETVPGAIGDWGNVLGLGADARLIRVDLGIAVIREFSDLGIISSKRIGPPVG